MSRVVPVGRDTPVAVGHLGDARRQCGQPQSPARLGPHGHPQLSFLGFLSAIAAGAGGQYWQHGDSLPEVPVPARRQTPGRWMAGAGCSTGLEEVAGETWLSSGTKHGTGSLSPPGKGLSSSFLIFPTRNPS